MQAFFKVVIILASLQGLRVLALPIAFPPILTAPGANGGSIIARSSWKYIGEAPPGLFLDPIGPSTRGASANADANNRRIDTRDDKDGGPGVTVNGGALHRPAAMKEMKQLVNRPTKPQAEILGTIIDLGGLPEF